MEKYKNLNNSSSIISYNSKADRIDVMFSDGSIYTYSYYKAGKEHVENMKKLAARGWGLNSYIMRFVRTLYD